MKYKTGTFNHASGDYGSISGYFSTWDRVPDSYGDVMAKGSFLETIAERKKTGHDFPFLYNHDFNQIIGRVTDIGEDNKGAYFTADFFPTERAQELREIVKASVLWQFSFAYSVHEQRKITLPDGTKANEIRKVSLYEVSLVGVPANTFTHITDIKDSQDGRAKDLLAYMGAISDPEEEKHRLTMELAKLEAGYGCAGSCQGAASERYYKRRIREVKEQLARLKKYC